jgi:chitodextrinase
MSDRVKLLLMRKQCPMAGHKVILCVLMLFCIGLTGQTQTPAAKVLVQNARGNSSSRAVVEVKWYSQGFIYLKGVNLYRRESGQTDWIRLNKTLILPQRTVPAPLLQRDGDLDTFLDMARNMGSMENNGFMLLTLFAKTFQSSDFSKLVGIQFDDASVQWGRTYEYRVTQMINAAEAELGISNAITAGNYRPAAPVAEFAVRLEKATAKMSWREEQERFYGVNVYRSTLADSSAWKKINKTPVVLSETEGAPDSDVMYQDADLQQGMTYYYRLAGLDFFGGETQLSGKVEITVGDITPPPPPLNLEKKVHVQEVTISWDTQPVEDLAGFHLYRSDRSDGPFEKITSQLVLKSDTAYTDLVPQPGFYYYEVAAADEAGNERHSNPIMVEVQDVIPPLAPVQLTIEADTGKFVLRWAKNKESDLKGYYIYRTIAENKNNSFLLINSEPVTDTVYTQVFAKNASNKFLFRVAAVDTSYNRSEPSEVVSARLPDVTPPIKPVIRNIALRNDTVFVSWLANPEFDLRGFNLYRSREGSDEKIRVNGDSLILPAATQYRDTVRAAGIFTYQVEAVDESGNASELSDAFPVTKKESFNFAFGEIEAKYHKRKKAVMLAWSQPRKPSGYIVLRRSQAEPAWRPVTGMIANAGFEDKGISRKTEYYYQVRAYSNNGEVVVSTPVLVRTGK